MSQPFKLYRLQQIDSQLDHQRARVAEIDAALSHNESLEIALDEEAHAAQILQEARRGLHKAEEGVKAQRLKIEQTSATLYGGRVRNPKELQDMQNELASLKRFINVLEDRQLENMLAVEDAEATHNGASEKLKTVKADTDKQQSELTSEKNNLLTLILKEETERQAAAAALPPADLEIYDQLRRTRRGVAVAKVADKACSACGATLSAALLQMAASPNQLTRCNSCGRILYSG